MARLKVLAKELKAEIYALYLAYRHPKTPIYAKIWLACVLGYAISPIDLIPDFIPVLGYLDDLVLIPLGISLAIKMMPPDILAECRAKAKEPRKITGPMGWIAAVIITLIWVGLAFLLLLIVWYLAFGHSANAFPING